MLSFKKKILEKFINNKFILFLFFSTILRIPHLIRAEFRLDSDGAHHWIVMENIINGNIFALHPYGLNHLGITDFSLALPISLFIGHNQYAYQIMLHLVFIIISIILYKITEYCFGNNASTTLLFLLALPNPVLFHFLVRPYGGHVLGSALMILSVYLLFISNNKDNKIFYLSLSSFLVGFGYYTSHLAIIIALPLLLYIFIYLVTYRKLVYFFAVLLSFFIGILPSIIGKLVQPYPDSYPNSSFNVSSLHFFDNASYSIKYIFPSLFGYFSQSGIEESGFKPPKDIKNLFPIINLYVTISFTYFIIVIFKNKLIKRNIHENYLIFSILVLLLNIMACLTTTNGLEGFGVRFFIPTIISIIPTYSAFLSGSIFQNKIWKKDIYQKIILYLHLFIFIISYGHGYLNFNSSLYTFEATPKINELVSVLSENKVKYCAADYWISYPIVYKSRFNILASPVKNLTLGPVRNPEITEKIIKNPNGIECLIYTIFTPLNISSKIDDIIIINSFKFKIIKSNNLDIYSILFVKEIK